MKGAMNNILSDQELARYVLEELEWEPSVRSDEIGVLVSEGVTTLTGYVSSYAERKLACRVAQRFPGVRAVSDALTVRPASGSERTDAELAHAARHTLEWYALVPHEHIQVTARDGCVKLAGEVAWAYQRAAAEEAISQLVGVKWLENDLLIEASADIKATEIEQERLLKSGAHGWRDHLLPS